jgi:protocatechuate 3,4-dioxygenase beta subunit
MSDSPKLKRDRFRRLLTLAVATLSTVTLEGHPQAPRDGSTPASPGVTIAGRVVVDSTGDPIRNARVLLTPAPKTTPGVLTDRDGRFSVTAPAGRYDVTASKSGYARSESTPATSGEAIEIRLRRSAAISGRVLDEFGDPASGVRVAVQTKERAAPDSSAVAINLTDDRGEYRLAGLTAGSFVAVVTTVRASTPGIPQSAPSSSIQRTYYPGVPTPAEAKELRLQPGEERTDIDFSVAAPIGQSRPFSWIGNIGPSGLRSTQNPDARSRGVVRGRAMTVDGQPLPRVQVTLLSTGTAGALGSAATTTDDEGRFEIREIVSGTFDLSGNKAGYVQVDGSGRPLTPTGPSGFVRSFDLAAGEVRERTDVMLARLGALTGRLSDENGDPIQDATVQALQVRYEDGRRWLVPANFSGGSTDDLGRYRIHDLAPGRYIVSAVTTGQVQRDDVSGYARTFYPGSSSVAEAGFVSIGLSEEVTGVDFALMPAPTVTVSGTALDAAGARVTAGVVDLLPSQRSSSLTPVSTAAQISPDGTFEFRNVSPDEYVIQMNRGGAYANKEGEFGSLYVTVTGTDISGLVLQTSLGSTIAGRVAFDVVDRTKVPALSRSNIELSPVRVDLDLSPLEALTRGEILGDGTFKMTGLHGPRRLQLTRVPPGWALKEIRVNGIDVTDQPLPLGRRDQSLIDVEVVLTDRITELSGTIADDHGRLVPGASVVVFPVERDRWYPSSRFLRRTSATADATFTVAGLPSGTYYVAAVERIPLDGAEAWQQAAFLEPLVVRASTVALGDGQKASLALRVVAR